VCVPGNVMASTRGRDALKMMLSLKKKGSLSVVNMIENLSRIWSMFFEM
jgi:hypothetical protein